MIPAGLHEWAKAQGCSPFHPLTWTDADRASFQAWKLAKFKARWKAYREGGEIERTLRQQGRDYLLRRVREDVLGALTPAPSDVYRHCPCHPSRPWPSPQSTQGPRTPADIVTWLSSEFTPGTAARRAAAALRQRAAGREVGAA